MNLRLPICHHQTGIRIAIDSVFGSTEQGIIMGASSLNHPPNTNESGKGQEAVYKAALSMGGLVLIPPTVGNDWNDAINAEANLCWI